MLQLNSTTAISCVKAMEEGLLDNQMGYLYRWIVYGKKIQYSCEKVPYYTKEQMNLYDNLHTLGNSFDIKEVMADCGKEGICTKIPLFYKPYDTLEPQEVFCLCTYGYGDIEHTNELPVYNEAVCGYNGRCHIEYGNDFPYIFLAEKDDMKAEKLIMEWVKEKVTYFQEYINQFTTVYDFNDKEI